MPQPNHKNNSPSFGSDREGRFHPTVAHWWRSEDLVAEWVEQRASASVTLTKEVMHGSGNIFALCVEVDKLACASSC